MLMDPEGSGMLADPEISGRLARMAEEVSEEGTLGGRSLAEWLPGPE